MLFVHLLIRRPRKSGWRELLDGGGAAAVNSAALLSTDGLAWCCRTSRWRHYGWRCTGSATPTLLDEQVKALRMTLHRLGNTSSSSLWYELAFTLMTGGACWWYRRSPPAQWKCHGEVTYQQKKEMILQGRSDNQTYLLIARLRLIQATKQLWVSFVEAGLGYLGFGWVARLRES